MTRFLLNNRISKRFFFKYFGIPKDKEIFKLQKNAIHYWEGKKAKCRVYQSNLWDISLIRRLKYVCLIGLVFLKNPIGFILATDTTATNDADGDVRSGQPNVCFGAITNRAAGYHAAAANKIMRILIRFTLPAGSGTISQISLFMYCYDNSGGAAGTVNVHQLTQASNFVESEFTWNIWKTGSSWATPGGDFNATIVHHVTNGAIGWHEWILRGAGADNSINTLTWEDTGTDCDFLLKQINENLQYWAYRVKENAEAEKPYLEITYSVAVPRSHGYIL